MEVWYGTWSGELGCGRRGWSWECESDDIGGVRSVREYVSSSSLGGGVEGAMYGRELGGGGSWIERVQGDSVEGVSCRCQKEPSGE